MKAPLGRLAEALSAFARDLPPEGLTHDTTIPFCDPSACASGRPPLGFRTGQGPELSPLVLLPHHRPAGILRPRCHAVVFDAPHDHEPHRRPPRESIDRPELLIDQKVLRQARWWDGPRRHEARWWRSLLRSQQRRRPRGAGRCRGCRPDGWPTGSLTEARRPDGLDRTPPMGSRHIGNARPRSRFSHSAPGRGSLQEPRPGTVRVFFMRWPSASGASTCYIIPCCLAIRAPLDHSGDSPPR